MRVLVTWGSRSGGTSEIGQTIAAQLKQRGHDVTALPARQVKSAAGYDAAVIGGALYANLWHADAYRFATRNIEALRQMPVWLFSSGPLDDSADRAEPPTPTQIGVLAERLGALEHITFGGRLSPAATGFPASAMAKTRSGDWRHLERARIFADDIAGKFPNARPGEAHEPSARSLGRLIAFAVISGASCAVSGLLGLGVLGGGWATAIHGVALPAVFAGASILYFGSRGSRDPLPTAGVFTAGALAIDALAALATGQGLGILFDPLGEWLPIALGFAVVLAVGQIMLMMPTQEQQRTITAKQPRRT